MLTTLADIWIISGPIFYQRQDVERIGVTAIPYATYKIIAWKDSSDVHHTRGYIVGQNDTSTELSGYLRSIDQIESANGFNFFPELSDDMEVALEAAEPDALWG